MLQIVMMFVLYVCLASAEDLSEPSRQEQLLEKANHPKADLPKHETQSNSQIVRADATAKQHQAKQMGLGQTSLNQPKNALADSKLAQDFKEEGPPRPSELSVKGEATPHVMKPLEEGGPPEPREQK